MAMRKWSKRKTMRVISAACYVVVPIFFCTLFLLMTMSYEDILHRSWHANDNTGSILAYIYHYLPRLGEFYQHITMRFMDFQTSLSFGIVFRLLDAVMCTTLIYLVTFFILKRRPQLAYKDALVYLGMFVLLMLFETCEVFMYRFSYVHNYILAMLVTVSFLLPYRLNLQSSRLPALASMVLLGFLFGISSEIAPVAITIILIGIALTTKYSQHLSAKQFFIRYRLQIFGFIGILLGLVFFYSGAGIGGRTNGGYGVAYEYIHISELFHDPLHTLAAIVRHLWYNLRYISFAFILLLLINFSEYMHKKQGRANQFFLQLMILVFCTLFVGASSLIKLHDDIYARFLFPVYIAIVSSLFIYLNEQLSRSDLNLNRFTQITCIMFLSIGALMTVDLTYAFARYRREVAPAIHEGITIQEDGSLLLSEEYPVPYMIQSPLFRFRQLNPLNWDSSNIYMKYDRQ